MESWMICTAVVMALVFVSWPIAIKVLDQGMEISCLIVFLMTFVGFVATVLLRNPGGLPQAVPAFTVLVTVGLFVVMYNSDFKFSMQAVAILGAIGFANGVSLYVLQIIATSLGSQFPAFQTLVAIVMIVAPLLLGVLLLGTSLNRWHWSAVVLTVLGAISLYRATLD